VTRSHGVQRARRRCGPCVHARAPPRVARAEPPEYCRQAHLARRSLGRGFEPRRPQYLSPRPPFPPTVAGWKPTIRNISRCLPPSSPPWVQIPPLIPLSQLPDSPWPPILPLSSSSSLGPSRVLELRRRRPQHHDLSLALSIRPHALTPILYISRSSSLSHCSLGIASRRSPANPLPAAGAFPAAVEFRLPLVDVKNRWRPAMSESARLVQCNAAAWPEAAP
jgi:hypothetical protein